MAEYKARRTRKRGGATKGEGATPPHGGHMLLIIGIAPKKPKKKAGGTVEGNAARGHLGKRARGGKACRADGGSTPPQQQQQGQDTGGGFMAGLRSLGDTLRPLKNVPSQMDKAAQDAKRARGGRALKAREDANDEAQDGRDKVSLGSGTRERAVEMGDARASGGRADHWIQGARQNMEKHGTTGALHRAMGVPAGDKIPERKLERAKARAEREGDTKMTRRITFAENVRR